MIESQPTRFLDVAYGGGNEATKYHNKLPGYLSPLSPTIPRVTALEKERAANRWRLPSLLISRSTQPKSNVNSTLADLSLDKRNMAGGVEGTHDPTSLLPADYVVPPSYFVQALSDRYIRATVLIAALESLWPGKCEVVVGALSFRLLQQTRILIEDGLRVRAFCCRTHRRGSLYIPWLERS